MATKKHKGPFTPQSSGERIAHARRLLGVYEGRDIDAAELARRVGVTVNAVYAWETGTIPGKANLARLAEVLRVTPEWIHYAAQPDIPPANSYGGKLSPAQAATGTGVLAGQVGQPRPAKQSGQK